MVGVTVEEEGEEGVIEVGVVMDGSGGGGGGGGGRRHRRRWWWRRCEG